jgi:NADPH:quinone reductase-like Zn-dependent oxidoreductase
MSQPVPEYMHAMLLTGHGGLDKLHYRDDIPVPHPGPDDVLIRVGACGMNNTDINTRIGWYSPNIKSGTTPDAGQSGLANFQQSAATWDRSTMSFPRIQGADIAGTIVRVGANVDSAMAGTRVLIDPWLRDWGDPNRLDATGFVGSECHGGYAEYTAVPARNAHPVHAVLTDAELATFPCAYATAENMLARVELGAGEIVLITGASGGVGSALVQLARRRGARVVAVAGQQKAEQVRRIGADVVIPRGVSDLGEAVSESVDVVADVVGGPSFPSLLNVLRRGGRCVISGAIAGPMAELDLRTLYLKDLVLHGATVTTPDIFPSLIRYIEKKEITPLLAQTYPLSQLHEAQEAFLQKAHVGKLVVVPDALYS